MTPGTGAAVHAGFGALFEGIRVPALDAIRTRTEMEVEEVISTAHSMGSIMAYFLLLELMEKNCSRIRKLNLLFLGVPELETMPLSNCGGR